MALRRWAHAFLLVLFVTGCATRHKSTVDDRDARPELRWLSARLQSILLQGQLPDLVDLPADRRAALLDPKYGYVHDYQQWRAYVSDYNHRLEDVFEYRTLPIIQQCTEDPLTVPWRLERWISRVTQGPAGIATAFAEADFLASELPAEARGTDTGGVDTRDAYPTERPGSRGLDTRDAYPTKRPGTHSQLRVVSGRPCTVFTNAIITAATWIDRRALGRVTAEQREWLQFVIPWICRSGGKFRNHSKGAPEYSLQWGFYPGDEFKAGDAVTSKSHTPIPPELRSVTAVGRYLRSLAGQPITGPEPLGGETGDFPQFDCPVDFEAMRQAVAFLKPVLSDKFLDALARDAAGWQPVATTVKGVEGSIVAVWDTPYGPIIFGGAGPNRYTDVEALAIVDLGGDDEYVFTHPETSIGRRPLQVIVDFAGDDVYQTQGVGGPAAGLLGVSILIDRAGNDRYCQGLSPLFQPRAHTRTTLVRPDPEGVNTSLVPFALLFGNADQPDQPGVALDAGFAFGAGFLGIGILVDEAGDDLYLGQKYICGVGFWRGIGVLHDVSGQDVYVAGLASMGVGINGAFGLLDDRAGDDHYQCLGTFESGYSAGKTWDNGYESHGIGYGSSWRAESRAGKPKRVPTLGGGVGVVHDVAGNDSYIASGFGIASGYAGGLGAVVDRAGDDTYFVKRGPAGVNTSGFSGNHALGNGCHRGVGYLLDCSGNDRYSASSLGGGTAWDLGLGYLLDLGGDDRLTDLHGKNARGNTGWGAAKAFAVSFHWGGTDVYERATFGDASAIADGYPGVGGNFSFFIDVGPETDTYPQANWNNTARLGGIAWVREADGREYPQGIGLFLDGPAAASH